MTKLTFVLTTFSFAFATGCMTDGIDPELTDEPGLEAELDQVGLEADLESDLEADLGADLHDASAREIAVSDDVGAPAMVIDPGDQARACGFSTNSYGTSYWNNCTSKYVTVRANIRWAKDVSYCVAPNSSRIIGLTWAARGAEVTLNGCG